MSDRPEPTYAERMFPAPVDLGIAEPDRGTDRQRFAKGWYA